MTSNRKRVLLFVIKSIFLIFRADDFTKSFLANLPFCRQPLLFLFYPFGFQCFVVPLSFAELSHFTTAATATPRPPTVSASNCLTAPFPYSTPSQQPIIPRPKLPFARPFGQFFLVTTVYSVANTKLCTSPFVKFFYPTHSFSQCFVGFPHFISYPPPTFSFVLVQSDSSKSFLHRPFIPPLCPLSPLITNQLEIFHILYCTPPPPLQLLLVALSNSHHQPI